MNASSITSEERGSQTTTSGITLRFPIKKAASGRRFIRPRVDAVAVRALHRQGNVWRRLFTGEQHAEDLLDGQAYVDAAASLLVRIRNATLHFVGKWWWLIVSALTIPSAIVWASLVYAPVGSTRVAVWIASVAGFLGISWTSIRATLGRALRQGESAMWDAEVTAAIGRAATILPKPKLDRPEALDVDKPSEANEGGEKSDTAAT